MRFSHIAFSLAAGLFAAAPAHALTVINDLTAPPGPYNLANPIGTVAGILVTNTDTYDFPFVTTGGPFDVLLQMQASRATPPDAQLLRFSLYRGLPGGGVFVANSGGFSLGPAIDLILGPDRYYLEIGPTDIVRNNALVSGGLHVTAVPEPAGWALMIGGVSLLGLVLRRRRMTGLRTA